MSEHTPGKWTLSGVKDFEGQYRVFVEPEAGGPAIAILRDYTTAEDKANGKLISEAPDTLAACQGALAALTQNKTYPADIKVAIKYLAAATEGVT